jgi:hypothetical protein
MKVCRACGELKELSEYYKHPEMADGHLNFCKICKRQGAIDNRNKRVCYYRQYDRDRMYDPARVAARDAYAKSDAGRLIRSRAKKNFSVRNPIARKCVNAVNNAIRDGRLTKQPCEVCGNMDKVHAHHDDYSKPLAVRWLCPKHHAEWHKSNEPIRMD